MTAKPLKPRLAVTILLTLITGVSSYALETEDSSALRSFEPAYFTQFAPRTALDMLQRVPGFQLQGGNTDRGLGQGGANVLLNGQQITGKGEDAFAQVGRVNAKNVVRIDIVDGGTLDIPGLSGQVANVITKETGISGTWQWQPEWRTDLKANLLPGRVTVSGEQGNLSYSAELKNNAFRNGHWGPETQTDGDGNVLRILDEKGQYFGDNPGASVNLTWKPRERHTGNLNLEFNQFNFNRTQTSIINPVTNSDLTGEELFKFSEDEWNAKVDGNYELPFLDGKLKLIGYYRGERSQTFARFRKFALNAELENHTEYHQTADEAELIARGEYSWSPSAGRDWQLATEGAFNYLDIGARFFDFTNNRQFPSGSRVEELRSEATLTHTRAISPKLSAQISLGGEYSEISQGLKVREFIRPKGFVSATYKPEDNFSIRAKIEREVGQLNFFDFIDAVSLEDNLNSVGNDNLVPSQSWLGELEFDRQFTGGHSLKLRVYGSKISDLVDRIPLLDENGFIVGDAVGNIDSAERYGAELNATLKGDALGLKGMELSSQIHLRNSSVRDPLEGFNRRLNGDLESFWNISFRHDIPETDLAWGFYTDQRLQAPVYRLNTYNQFTFDGPWAHVFVEHKDILGMKVNASLRNLFDASDDFERIIYDGPRGTGDILRVEKQDREFDLFFRLTFSGTF